MTKITKIFLILLFSFFLIASTSTAEDKKSKPGAKKGGRPPAVVAIGAVTSGVISPEGEFIGTVFFQEVSEVAAEVRGKVVKVFFEEGRKVQGAGPLVTLDSDLLETEIKATVASRGQVLVELERAQIDFARLEELYKEKFVSDRAFDESRFMVQGLIKQAASMEATIEGLRVELEKKTIKAPFAGVVLSRSVDRGEWIEVGETVATIAKLDAIDIIVDLPDRNLKFVKVGMEVSVAAGGEKLKGKVFAIIPSGDVKTRTFPVKIRMNRAGLLSGMEARVSLPRGASVKALIVERDAVIQKYGKTVVFSIIDGKAKMIPVRVVGYSGNEVGVAPLAGDALHAGMNVVTKGNERINDGQSAVAMGKGK